ncbi:hypothetical protein [Aeromonas media]|uniref:hypothetical protein n=1 Tax=Aeromonas media TaxID=651 RepID=UPI003D196983
MYTKSDIEAFQSAATQAMEHYKSRFPSAFADYFVLNADFMDSEMSFSVRTSIRGGDPDETIYSKEADLAGLKASDFLQDIIDDIDQEFERSERRRIDDAQREEEKQKQERYQQFLELQKEFGEQPTK